MAIDPGVKGIWTFNSTLEEEVAGNDFQVATTGATYENLSIFDFGTSSYTNRKGLKILPNVSFYADTIDHLSGGNYQFLTMFWWKSMAALGQTRHAITRKVVPKVSPIIAKAETTTADGYETVTLGEWIISEIGYSKTQNAIQLSLCSGGSTITHIYQSDPYYPGTHHVGIRLIYTSANNYLVQLIINGKPGVLHLGPSSMASTVANIYINSVGAGYTAHQTTQSGGVIADLSIQSNATEDTEAWPLKQMRFGLGHVTDADLMYNNPTFNAIAFRQPCTITTKQILKVGENIVVARSNGELLSGARPIWDTEFDYTDQSIVDRLVIGNIDSCPPGDGKRTVCWTEDGLRVEGTTIRI